MNNYLLKFTGLGLFDKYQACVSIYDSCGNLVIRKRTYNGELKVCLDFNKKYYLCARSFNENIKTSFFTCKKVYIFYFSRSIYKKYTFLLTDPYYKGLNIEKGEIILWQK